jgi:hypothetical protein
MINNSKGIALLMVLFIGTAILSSAAWLAQRNGWQTGGEQQRQAWHRARLVAYGGVDFVRFNLKTTSPVSIASLKLSKAPIEAADWEKTKNKMTAVQTPLLPLPTRCRLWLGYDATTQQAVSYCELADTKGKVLTRVLCKAYI